MRNPFKRDKPQDVTEAPATDTLTDRRVQMLKDLEVDLTAMGWDQPAKLYAVTTHGDEEFFELAAEIKGHPADMLNKLASTNRPSDNVVALVLAFEGWAYPADMMTSGGTPEDAEALAQLYKMSPPSEHPNRRETRLVVLVDREGTTLQVTRTRDADLEVLTDGQMGGTVVDSMRRVLGLDVAFNDTQQERAQIMMGAMAEIAKGFALAQENHWTPPQFMEYVKDHVPADITDTLFNDPNMPPEVRKILGLDS